MTVALMSQLMYSVTPAAYLVGERVDLSLGFVQASGELAVLLVALAKLALHSLQLQPQRLTLRLSRPQTTQN